MAKRNAIRIGMDPHSAESVAFTIHRYGPIQPGTLKEILAWLGKHTDEYVYEVKDEMISDISTGEILSYKVLKTNRKGSAIMKYIDNEHDAQNTLANIRNKDFPKNKQGQ